MLAFDFEKVYFANVTITAHTGGVYRFIEYKGTLPSQIQSRPPEGGQFCNMFQGNNQNHDKRLKKTDKKTGNFCLKHFSFFLFRFMDIFYLNPTSTILFAFTVTTIHQFFDLMCPVYRCLMISNLNVSSTGQRLEYHENITDTITLILCVITFRLARFHTNRLVHLNNVSST